MYVWVVVFCDEKDGHYNEWLYAVYVLKERAIQDLIELDYNPATIKTAQDGELINIEHNDETEWATIRRMKIIE